MVGQYNYEDFGIWNRSYSIFLMIFLIATNVFLLNLLVAVIDTIYQYMIKQAEFYAKKYRFEFWRSKKHAFEVSPDDLDCFVNHCPPYNVLTLILIVFMPFKNIRTKLSAFIENFIFWIDNCIMTFCLIVVEILLVPICYLKITLQLFSKLNSKRCWLFACVLFWLFLGLLCLLFFIALDVKNQYKLFRTDFQEIDDDDLSMSDYSTNLNANQEKDMERRVRVFNEIRLVVQTTYRECVKRQKIRRIH